MEQKIDMDIGDSVTMGMCIIVTYLKLRSGFD